MTPKPTPPVFPQDEGAHPGINSEWWYVFGFLNVAGQERYSFFGSHSDTPNGLDSRFNIPFPNIGGAEFLESSLTDLRSGEHVQSYLLCNYPPVIIGPPALHPGLTKGRLDETFTDGNWSWSLKRVDENTVTLKSNVEWGALDLVLTQKRPPLLVGDKGVVHMGPKGLSSYYSMTRFDVAGTFTRNGTTEAVTGTVWHDHQWGDMELFNGYEGWTWLGLNLDDGTDLNLFRFHEKDQRPVTVNFDIMRPDGSQSGLPSDLNAMSSLGAGWWQSPKTSTWFPLEWTVRFPTEQMDLHVAAAVKDQENAGMWPYASSVSLVPTFYEGACRVTGTLKGKPITGRGYLEMFGGTRS